MKITLTGTGSVFIVFFHTQNLLWHRCRCEVFPPWRWNYVYHLVHVLVKAYQAKWPLMQCFKAASHTRYVVSPSCDADLLSAKMTYVGSDWVQPVTDFIFPLHAWNDLLPLQCRNRCELEAQMTSELKQYWSTACDTWTLYGMVDLVNFWSYSDL